MTISSKEKKENVGKKRKAETKEGPAGKKLKVVKKTIKSKSKKAESLAKKEVDYKKPVSLPCLKYIDQTSGEDAKHCGPTLQLAIDCEMVGIGPGGQKSVLARVSVVNALGQCIYDTFVKPTAPVTDYRTWVSGVRPQDVENAPTFDEVQNRMRKMLLGRVLIGHAVSNDLEVLFLDHAYSQVRDTALYEPYVEWNCGRAPSLKRLTEGLLRLQIQKDEHSSVTDAKATMALYMLRCEEWERDLAEYLEYAKTRSPYWRKKLGLADTPTPPVAAKSPPPPAGPATGREGPCTRSQQVPASKQLDMECLKLISSHKGVDPGNCGPTRALALDCEMVAGYRGRLQLARCSITNARGQCIYDKFVRPQERVTNYLTWVSGIRPSDVVNGTPFHECRREVAQLLRGRILVAHSVSGDLTCLSLDHPVNMIRDTSTYPGYKQLKGGMTPGLKMLSQVVLGLSIQEGEHSSVTDAKATMALYLVKYKEWEACLGNYHLDPLSTAEPAVERVTSPPGEVEKSDNNASKESIRTALNKTPVTLTSKGKKSMEKKVSKKQAKALDEIVKRLKPEAAPSGVEPATPEERADKAALRSSSNLSTSTSAGIPAFRGTAQISEDQKPKGLASRLLSAAAQLLRGQTPEPSPGKTTIAVQTDPFLSYKQRRRQVRRTKKNDGKRVFLFRKHRAAKRVSSKAATASTRQKAASAAL